MEAGEMQRSPNLSVASSSSPSFSSYSNSSSLADIAARVVQELRAENNDETYDDSEFLGVADLYCALEQTNNDAADFMRDDDIGKLHEDKGDIEDHLEDKDDEEEEEEEEFEFAFVPRDTLISADQIFYNGQIRPLFPIFNRNLLLGDASSSSLTSGDQHEQQTVSATLRKLLDEDRETPSSCSSSEAGVELDGIPAGTYCVWRPKAAVKEEEGKCKKSKSTGGSSKRWRLRDLVHRSNSDGKQTFVFLIPSFRKGDAVANNNKVDNKTATSESSGKSKAAKGADKGAPTTHYTNNRGDKRRSYLPYRQDFVGFFANVNL